MRIAAIYDVHGNLPALEAVLADAQVHGVDQVVYGGDVLPGPMPKECLALLMKSGARCIKGNGEAEAVLASRGEELVRVPEAFRAAIHWAIEEIGPQGLEQIETWPSTLTIDIEGTGTVLFCHATPRSDVEIFTKLTPEDRVVPAFEGVDADLVVCGHTHMQFDRSIGQCRVVNAGSVGMPFGEPGAYWLLIDGDKLEHRRTDYDVDSAVKLLAGVAMPGAAEWAEGNVRNPRSEEQMLVTLESRAMGS